MSIKNKIVVSFPEPLRTALGDYYAPVQKPSGTVPEYQRTPLPNTPSFSELAFGDYFSVALASVLQLETKTTGSTIIPSYILPVRLYGNSAIIKNNEFWKRFMIGGTFGTSSFEGVYTNNVYKNLNFTYNTAYTAKEFMARRQLRFQQSIIIIYHNMKNI